MNPKDRFKIPENATPEFLIDEMARLSIVVNYAKKQRKMFREALFARVGVNPEHNVPVQSHLGETYVMNITQSPTSRFNTSKFKDDHPDLYNEYLTTSNITYARPQPQPGKLKDDAEDLVLKLYAELGLDEIE